MLLLYDDLKNWWDFDEKNAKAECEKDISYAQ